MSMQPDSATLQDAWRALLPDNVEIVGGPMSNAAPALTLAERESAGGVAPERMLELRTGRQYAKQALSSLGIRGIELPILPDRSPSWPDGITGSITHARGRHQSHCAVAVALTTQYSSIGIDIEYQQVVPPEIWPTFLTVREIGLLQIREGVLSQEDVLCRWCVKEAIIKAARTGLDPLTIETEKIVDGKWSAYPAIGTRFGASSEFPWSVRTALAEGFAMAAVAVSRL